MADRRFRDPLHDLIHFSESDELERVLLQVIETRPFQRLRRIKQLGFSEVVFPGATHSRLAHSIGVFHTARKLMDVVRRSGAPSNPSKEQRALAAALVHDLGHGPFSHAFEKIGKKLHLDLADHERMSERIIVQSEVTDILNSLGSGFADDVAKVIKKEGLRTVHHAVVTSQFDADRLDYMQRDRMMTGSQHSTIDFTWLIANLEVGGVPDIVDDQIVGKVDTFVLGPKAEYAAEAYVLGLFQLYQTIYFHKTTRGAEALFAELIQKAIECIRDSSTTLVGLPKKHPLVRFALHPNDLDKALGLDDSAISGAIGLMCESSEPGIAELAQRLNHRKLFKAIDIRNIVSSHLNALVSNSEDLISRVDKTCGAVCQRLQEWSSKNQKTVPRIIVDVAERSPYRSFGETRGPLDRINIMLPNGALVDLKERSKVVAALKTFKICRAYHADGDAEAVAEIENAIGEY